MDNRPGASVSLIFYVFLFIITLVVTIAVTVVGVLPLKLPPPVQQFLPWRLGCRRRTEPVYFPAALRVAAVRLQPSRTTTFTDWYKARLAAKEGDAQGRARATVPKVVNTEAEEGDFALSKHQTTVFKAVVFLHLLALVVALLMLWLNHREKIGRPVPRIDLQV